MSKTGERILNSIRKTTAQLRGKNGGGFVVHAAPESVNVRAIRSEQNLTQEQFSQVYALPLGCVRDWEQGKAKPDTAARVLLKVIKHDPEAVRRALAAP